MDLPLAAVLLQALHIRTYITVADPLCKSWIVFQLLARNKILTGTFSCKATFAFDNIVVAEDDQADYARLI